MNELPSGAPSSGKVVTPPKPQGPYSHANPPPVSEPVKAPGGATPKGGLPMGVTTTTPIRPPVPPMGGSVPTVTPTAQRDYFDTGPLERPL